MALRRARTLLELVLRDVYERRFHEPPGTRPLESLIQRFESEGGLPSQFDAAALLDRLNGPGTARWGESAAPADVDQALAQVAAILKWYIEVEQPDSLAPSPGSARSQRQPRPGQAKRHPPPSDHALPLFPRGCARSTATTATSSSSFWPAHATRRACPRASGSGSTGSRAATIQASRWAWSTGPAAAVSRRWSRPASSPASQGG